MPPTIFFVQERRFANGESEKTDIGSTSNEGGASYDSINTQGVYRTGRRPVFENFRGDLYLGGSYSRPLVRHATDRRWLLAGITPPRDLLSVVPGSGSGGSSGGALAYITFLHKEGLRVLAESNPSNIVNLGELTGEGRLWSNIQATGAELRTTHVRGYVSMIGGPYRMAWESPYGITTIEENTPSAALSLLGINGGQGDFRNGVPPIGINFIHPWAGRMWYANNAEFPYRVWYSQPGWPQYVGKASFRDTLEREPVTGIWRGRNELIVFCADNSYMIRQFGAGFDDFVLERLDSNVGCITHHGIREIHNRVWFPARDGIWIFDGSFRYIMEDLRLLWEKEYCLNRAAFDGGWGVFDKLNKVYIFKTPRGLEPIPEEGVNPEEWLLPPIPEWETRSGLFAQTVGYVGYLGNFEPSMGGRESQPDWTLDFKGREDSADLYGRDNELYTASCDGAIRRQIKACELVEYFEDPENEDREDYGSTDDGDSLQKRLVIRHGHQLMFQPGDDVQSGKKLHQIWMHVESETTPWRLYAMGGDEDTWRSERPTNVRRFWKYDNLASRQIETRTVDGNDYAYLACGKSVHFHVPEKVSGRGFTFESTADDVIGVNYRGIGGLWAPGGVGFRPPCTEQLIPEYTLDLTWRVQGDPDWLEPPIEAIVPQTGGTVDIELRSLITDLAGLNGFPNFIGFPVGLTLDFEGTNLPADDTDSIAGLLPDFTGEVITPAQFTGLDTTAGVGTLQDDAVDSNGKPSISNPVLAAIFAAVWSQTIEYRIDVGGGGFGPWTPWVPPVPIGPVSAGADIIEVRTVLSGTVLPCWLWFFHADLTPIIIDPVLTAGIYATHVETYPGFGFGTYSGSSTFRYPAGGGFAHFINTNFLITWGP